MLFNWLKLGSGTTHTQKNCLVSQSIKYVILFVFLRSWQMALTTRRKKCWNAWKAAFWQVQAKAVKVWDFTLFPIAHLLIILLCDLGFLFSVMQFICSWVITSSALIFIGSYLKLEMLYLVNFFSENTHWIALETFNLLGKSIKDRFFHLHKH